MRVMMRFPRLFPRVTLDMESLTSTSSPRTTARKARFSSSRGLQILRESRLRCCMLAPRIDLGGNWMVSTTRCRQQIRLKWTLKSSRSGPIESNGIAHSRSTDQEFFHRSSEPRKAFAIEGHDCSEGISYFDAVIQHCMLPRQ